MQPPLRPKRRRADRDDSRSSHETVDARFYGGPQVLCYGIRKKLFCGLGCQRLHHRDVRHQLPRYAMPLL